MSFDKVFLQNSGPFGVEMWFCNAYEYSFAGKHYTLLVKCFKYS